MTTRQTRKRKIKNDTPKDINEVECDKIIRKDPKDENVINENAVDETVSVYFSKEHITELKNEGSSKGDNVAERVFSLVDSLNGHLRVIKFGQPVKCVYNPTEYAFDSFRNYVLKYGNRPKEVLFVGMNPGPWGMSQTGVPFGEVNAVRDWLKVTGTIGKPPVEDVNRPVLGFECHRSEVSGQRFWGLAKHLSITPERFFQNCYIHNYCPLQFIGPNGKNVTPDGLKRDERDSLYSVCDKNLLETIKTYECKTIVGIGKFAEIRVNKIFKENNINNIKVYSIPHPSPRAQGNNDWQNKTLKVMEELKLIHYFKA